MLQCNQHAEGPQNAPKYAFRDSNGEGNTPSPYPTYVWLFGGASIRAPWALDLPPMCSVISYSAPVVPWQ